LYSPETNSALNDSAPVTVSVIIYSAPRPPEKYSDETAKIINYNLFVAYANPIFGETKLIPRQINGRFVGYF